jgi:selenoprotein W-related protein
MASVRIRITYCVPCGYQPTALSLAQELLSRLGMKYNRDMELTLVPVDKGEFDVYVNEKKVFSRFEARRFPTADEIAKAVEGAQAPRAA